MDANVDAKKFDYNLFEFLQYVTVYFSGWKYIVFFYIIKLIIVIVNTLPSALSDIGIAN
jgi:hypothetical protein